MLHGLIAGHIYRAYALCSDESDAKQSVIKLWHFLKARGYSSNTLKPIFSLALKNRRTTAPAVPAEHPDFPPHWFLKIPYHPQDPSSWFIQKAWKSTVANPRLAKPLASVDMKYRTLGHRRFVVCYQRARNLGNYLTYRKILPTSGPPVSSFIL